MKKIIFILIALLMLSCRTSKQASIENHIRERLRISFSSTPRRSSPPRNSTYRSPRSNFNSISKPKY